MGNKFKSALEAVEKDGGPILRKVEECLEPKFRQGKEVFAKRLQDTDEV